MNAFPLNKRISRILATVALAACSAACAAAFSTPPVPGPQEIPRLRAELARDSSGVLALTRLGAAERAAGNATAALPLLDRAHALQPSDPAAVLYLGLTYEDLSQPARARTLYEEYLRVGRSPELKRQLEHRLLLLQRQEVVVAARREIANEATLSQQTPEPSTVAVFPFIYSGADSALVPLGRALSELLVTDLGQVTRLRVLERARVQVLLDEMALSTQGLVDSTTAARSGKLLGAATVVQGQLSGTEEQLRLDAAVVPVARPANASLLAENDPLRALFEMQKRLSLGVIQSLGVELTPAERDRVLRRPTASLEALLAFGRCLTASDAGDYGAASAACGEAARLDPGFAAARTTGAEMRQLSGSASVSTSDLSRLAGGELATAGLDLAALDQLQLLVPSPVRRDPALEVEGTEGGGKPPAIIKIIIRHP